MTLRAPRFVFYAVLIAYIVLAAGYAVRTPDWQAPDEPAHYNYIAQISANGCCPLIEDGDWDQEYLSALTTARFAPELLDGLPEIQYEDHQPPLYYLLGAPIFSLTGGSLLALRLFSVVLGAGVIALTYGIGLQVAPGRPWVAVGAAAFVAFLPQHTAILASVNNDALSELVIAAALYGLIRRVRRRENVPIWALGVLVGLGALTKASTLFLFGLVPIVLVTQALLERHDRRRVLIDLAVFLAVSLAIASLWWVRNLTVYGMPDFLGLRAHDAVVVGQLRTADRIAEWGWDAFIRSAFETTFNSFFGQFGWMALPMPAWMLQIFAVMLLAALAGLGVRLVAFRRLVATSRADQIVWFVLGLALMFGIAQFIYYNIEFVQPQGRYLFAVLVPFALIVAWGWDALARLLARLLPPAESWVAALPLLIALVLLPLNAYNLWRFIPLLAP